MDLSIAELPPAPLALASEPGATLSPTEAEGLDLLRHAITAEFRGRIAVVSSFGAESALLLALVAAIDPATPVLFLDTGQHFPETLAYRHDLARHLGLTDIRDVAPAHADTERHDPDSWLWHFDPDACCALRKVEPLNAALASFDAWITGRKRHQSTTRAALPLIERIDGKVKINPLAAWSRARIEAEFAARRLPAHRLTAHGFASIGCAPCTRATRAGEDPRAGRWAGRGKVECGIHGVSAEGDVP